MPSQHGDGWSARWTDHEGKRRRMTFRFKRDAEAYERKMKGEQEEIRRGLRGLPPPPKPFESICSYWLEHRASQKRSGNHDESIIRAHLRPAPPPLRRRSGALSRRTHGDTAPPLAETGADP